MTQVRESKKYLSTIDLLLFCVAGIPKHRKKNWMTTAITVPFAGRKWKLLESCRANICSTRKSTIFLLFIFYPRDCIIVLDSRIVDQRTEFVALSSHFAERVYNCGWSRTLPVQLAVTCWTWTARIAAGRRLLAPLEELYASVATLRPSIGSTSFTSMVRRYP